jgi:hypothetical protein
MGCIMLLCFDEGNNGTSITGMIEYQDTVRVPDIVCVVN